MATLEQVLRVLGERFDELKNGQDTTNNRMETINSDLSGKIEATNTAIETISSGQAELKSELKGELEGTNATIGILGSELQSLKSELSYTNDNIRAVKNELTRDANTAHAQINTNIAKICSEMRGEYNEIRTTVDSLTTRMEEFTTKVNSDVGEIGIKVDKIATDIQSTTTGLEDKITFLSTEISGIHERIATEIEKRMQGAECEMQRRVSKLEEQQKHEIRRTLEKTIKKYDTLVENQVINGQEKIIESLKERVTGEIVNLDRKLNEIHGSMVQNLDKVEKEHQGLIDNLEAQIKTLDLGKEDIQEFARATAIKSMHYCDERLNRLEGTWLQKLIDQRNRYESNLGTDNSGTPIPIRTSTNREMSEENRSQEADSRMKTDNRYNCDTQFASTTIVRFPEEKPRKFTGNNMTHPKEFLREMEEYFRDSRTHEEQKLRVIGRCLEGSAKIWFQAFKSGMENYEQFSKLFLNKYWSMETQLNLRAELYSNQYSSTTPTYYSSFFASQLTKMKNLDNPPTQEEIIRALIRQFPRETQDVLIAANIQNYLQFDETLRKLDHASEYQQKLYRARGERAENERRVHLVQVEGQMPSNSQNNTRRDEQSQPQYRTQERRYNGRTNPYRTQRFQESRKRERNQYIKHIGKPKDVRENNQPAVQQEKNEQYQTPPIESQQHQGDVEKQRYVKQGAIPRQQQQKKRQFRNSRP